MRTFRILNILTALFLLFCKSYGQISQVNSMKEVMDHFKNASEDTLGVFDIDMVLLQPSEPAFQMKNIKLYVSIAKRIMRSIPQEKKEIFLTLMTMHSEAILIDEKTPSYLQELYFDDLPMIALTANLTGKFAHIPNIESWKESLLRGVGIDFSCFTPYQEPIVFDKLPSYRGNYSVFTNGLLFANGYVCPKGDVLVHFLQAAQLFPKEVIFIDDREENLKNVEAALQQYNPTIHYVGLHYVGAQDYPADFITEKEFETRWQAIADQAMQMD